MVNAQQAERHRGRGKLESSFVEFERPRMRRRGPRGRVSNAGQFWVGKASRKVGEARAWVLAGAMAAWLVGLSCLSVSRRLAP